jgi:hypothetical protein
MSRQDALKSKEVFVPGRGYLKRASVPSVPKKLSHNGLGACESVPESVLASVPRPEDHGPRDQKRSKKFFCPGGERCLDPLRGNVRRRGSFTSRPEREL